MRQVLDRQREKLGARLEAAADEAAVAVLSLDGDEGRDSSLSRDDAIRNAFKNALGAADDRVVNEAAREAWHDGMIDDDGAMLWEEADSETLREADHDMQAPAPKPRRSSKKKKTKNMKAAACAGADDVNSVSAECESSGAAHSFRVLENLTARGDSVLAGDPKAATIAYRAALSGMKTATAHLQYQLGDALSRVGDNGGATEAYRACTSAAPECGKAHVVLGAMLMQDKDLQAALEHLQTAVELDPLDSDAHGYLIAALTLKGDKEGARTAAERWGKCVPLADARAAAGELAPEPAVVG